MLGLGSQSAVATEAGGGNYPNGAESYLVTPPPPGIYTVVYANHYSADRFNDRNGKSSIPNFSIEANSINPRVLVVSPELWGGQRFGMMVLIPVVNLTVHTPALRQERTGLGNLNLTLFATSDPLPNFHLAYGIDIFFNTGKYDPRAVANPSPGFGTYELVFAASYSKPNGPQLDLKLMYDFNEKNDDTNYKSGQVFHADYAAGWNAGPLTAGIGGYVLRQTTDDRVGGIRVGSDGFRGRVFAVGPELKYNFDPIQVWFQYQREFSARNRPQGDNFWLKTVIRF